MLTLLATIRTPALLIIGLLAPMRFRAPSTASEACMPLGMKGSLKDFAGSQFYTRVQTLLLV